MTPTLSDRLSRTAFYVCEVIRCRPHPWALSALEIEIGLDASLSAEDRRYLVGMIEGTHPGVDSDIPNDPPVDDDSDSDDDSPLEPTDDYDESEPIPQHVHGDPVGTYRDRAAVNVPCGKCGGSGELFAGAIQCGECEGSGTTPRW